jgi:hypothetical protein
MYVSGYLSEFQALGNTGILYVVLPIIRLKQLSLAGETVESSVVIKRCEKLPMVIAPSAPPEKLPLLYVLGFTHESLQLSDELPV